MFNYKKEKNIQINKQVEFECYIRNKGDYNVAWYRGGQVLAIDEIVVFKNIYKIIERKESNNVYKYNLLTNASISGLYKCQLMIASDKLLELEYDLNVLGK